MSEQPSPQSWPKWVLLLMANVLGMLARLVALIRLLAVGFAAGGCKKTLRSEKV